MNNDTDRPIFKRPELRAIEYRLYYDVTTGVGVLKNTGEQVPSLSYIVLDESTYRSIDFCSKYKVVNGVLTGRAVKQTAKKLEKSRAGQFNTIKNNMLFLVDPVYNGLTDCWDHINDN